METVATPFVTLEHSDMFIHRCNAKSRMLLEYFGIIMIVILFQRILKIVDDTNAIYVTTVHCA